MLRSLVGSEMCIRDRLDRHQAQADLLPHGQQALGSSHSRPLRIQAQQAVAQVRVLEARAADSSPGRHDVPPQERELMMLSSRGTHRQAPLQDHQRASNHHSGGSSMAKQGLVARPPGIENRPRDHSSSARRHSGVSGSQPVLRLPASKTGYLEDIRCALQDLRLSEDQITLTPRGLPPYRSMWQQYKVWCRDAGRLVWSVEQVSSFSFEVATQQLAEFLAYMASSGKVGSAGTLCNYRWPLQAR